jgi:hypothetical protein
MRAMLRASCRTGRNRCPGLLALLVTGMLPAAPVRAQDWWSSWIGRETPVTTVALSCPTSTYAVGVVVKAGTWLDAMRLECGTLGTNGEHQSVSNTAWTSFAQQSSAAVLQLRCAGGKVLVGFKGRSGTWIDRIQAGCRSWSQSLGAYGTLSWTSAAGGSTGSEYGPITCPGNKAVTAVKAKPIEGALGIRPPVIEAYQFRCHAT